MVVIGREWRFLGEIGGWWGINVCCKLREFNGAVKLDLREDGGKPSLPRNC
ncbi:MAG: hypothetical protein JW984_11315 [Deltaproteobacteria bacterium]|uniref:Uncharacterized protein n=1 Tax=Candidatus Zymogenus saltonus TaxID=2844893 RepID=A0A9D8KFL0_9DELT|nr:hypothetical protein [Candidatus Zymogenus saltonus]